MRLLYKLSLHNCQKEALPPRENIKNKLIKFVLMSQLLSFATKKERKEKEFVSELLMWCIFIC